MLPMAPLGQSDRCRRSIETITIGTFLCVIQQKSLDLTHLMAAEPTATVTPPDGVSLRLVEPGDYDRNVLGVLAQLTVVGEVPREVFVARLQKMKERGAQMWVIVDDAGAVRGCATLLVEPKLIHGCGAVGHIEDVVVDSVCRGRKFGELLISHLCSVAAAEGCYKVILDCDEKNVGFYNKCGFTTKGVMMRRDVGH
jgi:glucosamine-phosphate N-acetyltransferase